MKHLRQYIMGLLKEEMITIYHHTSPESSEAIRQSGSFSSKIKTDMGTEVYFSNRPEGQAAGYGTSHVAIEIPQEYTVLDDEFPDGEQHYYVTVRNIEKFGRIL